jgi:hypothetical protein
MPYFVAKFRSETQVLCDLLLTDEVRRDHLFLRDVKKGAINSVGTGRFRRKLMTVDILEWAENQEPRWALEQVVTTAPTQSDPSGGWAFFYFREL